jgi:18S rRNA (guanine1575-N7)-methyltransferase
MAKRAFSMLAIPPGRPSLILDIGCGSGLSGAVLTEAGHTFIGMDIAPDMLAIAAGREDPKAHLAERDMGRGVPFRSGIFDGAISISALQWLCHSNRKAEEPYKRLFLFFQSLYTCMARGARCVFQVYPKDAAQLEMMASAARRAGFTGGIVTDFPNSSKARKDYLCLFAGVAQEDAAASMPTARDGAAGEDDDDEVLYEKRAVADGRFDRLAAHTRKEKRRRLQDTRAQKGSREWVLKKKVVMREEGRDVRHDSKYTGRKRQRNAF